MIDNFQNVPDDDVRAHLVTERKDFNEMHEQCLGGGLPEGDDFYSLVVGMKPWVRDDLLDSIREKLGQGEGQEVQYLFKQIDRTATEFKPYVLFPLVEDLLQCAVIGGMIPAPAKFGCKR